MDIQIDRCADECWNTLPIPWKQNKEAYQLRYVFGYAMDGSDLPCYILWPARTAEQSFWCIDAWKGDWVRMDKCSYMAPLGIEHFFDAFCFEPQRPWRAAACQALDIPSCHVSKDTYLEQGHENKFSLTPRRIPVERKTPAAKREVDQDMVAKEESVSDAESGWSGVSDNSTPPRTLNVLMWRPPRWPLTRTDLTRPVMLFVTWQMTWTTLTSDGTLEVSPVRMQLVFR